LVQRIRKKNSAIIRVQKLGESMANVWRCCASHLSETVNLHLGVLGTDRFMVTACVQSVAAECKQSEICNMANASTTLVAGDYSTAVPVTPKNLQLQRAISDITTSSPRKRSRGECGHNIEVW